MSDSIAISKTVWTEIFITCCQAAAISRGWSGAATIPRTISALYLRSTGSLDARKFNNSLGTRDCGWFSNEIYCRRWNRQALWQSFNNGLYSPPSLRAPCRPGCRAASIGRAACHQHHWPYMVMASSTGGTRVRMRARTRTRTHGELGGRERGLTVNLPLRPREVSLGLRPADLILCKVTSVHLSRKPAARPRGWSCSRWYSDGL